MSAVRPQVRPAVPPTARAHAAQPVPRAVARSAPLFASVSADEDEFKVQLADIPVERESLDVDGLKPSMLSRLLNLVAPISK